MHKELPPDDNDNTEVNNNHANRFHGHGYVAMLSGSSRNARDRM